jgi:SseB protein C-terminal domain/SseB protein N-terminal domain
LPSKESRNRAGEGETIRPIIIESEGKKYVMLFDTKERLSSWAKREVGIVGIRGHVVVEIMSADIQWALNVGTDHVKIFVPDEIKWLKENVAKAAEEKLAKGTTVRVGAPANIPAGLVESLIKTLLGNPEVIEAYLAQVHYVKEGEKPHLALVLRIDATPVSILEAIRKELATASQYFLNQGEFIDIFVNDRDLQSEVAKVVRPFYVRKPPR